MTLKAEILNQIRADFKELMEKRDALSDEDRAVLDARVEKALRDTIEGLKASSAYTEPNKTLTWQRSPVLDEDIVIRPSLRFKDFPLPKSIYSIHGD